MSPRSLNRSGSVPSDGGTCIVVCTRSDEADQIGRRLSHLDGGCLFAYEHVTDMVRNVPAGDVDLVVLAIAAGPKGLRRTLEWIKGRWRRCMCVVVSSNTSRVTEMAAREYGALYLGGPVHPEQWDGVLCGVKQMREAKLTS
jgi:hypothetical protein